jgi:hypothetical protein
MDQLAQSRFHKKLAEFLRTELPDQVESMTDEELHLLITKQEAKASKYDILAQASVAKYVSMTVIYGEGFDQSPEVQELFAEPSEFSNEDKLDFLLDALEGEDESHFDQENHTGDEVEI